MRVDEYSAHDAVGLGQLLRARRGQRGVSWRQSRAKRSLRSTAR